MHSVRQFEMIRALARHRHFGRAAAELGVSQPALTRSLQHLEDDLAFGCSIATARSSRPCSATF